ncbi:unnamed protein product [Peniophora sp. CBMAI 1063]|nr:unnamed protein product [Peniophora sp. CBMAI 1063]
MGRSVRSCPRWWSKTATRDNDDFQWAEVAPATDEELQRAGRDTQGVKMSLDPPHPCPPVTLPPNATRDTPPHLLLPAPSNIESQAGSQPVAESEAARLAESLREFNTTVKVMTSAVTTMTSTMGTNMDGLKTSLATTMAQEFSKLRQLPFPPASTEMDDTVKQQTAKGAQDTDGLLHPQGLPTSGVGHKDSMVVDVEHDKAHDVKMTDSPLPSKLSTDDDQSANVKMIPKLSDAVVIIDGEKVTLKPIEQLLYRMSKMEIALDRKDERTNNEFKTLLQDLVRDHGTILDTHAKKQEDALQSYKEKQDRAFDDFRVTQTAVAAKVNKHTTDIAKNASDIAALQQQLRRFEADREEKERRRREMREKKKTAAAVGVDQVAASPLAVGAPGGDGRGGLPLTDQAQAPAIPAEDSAARSSTAGRSASPSGLVPQTPSSASQVPPDRDLMELDDAVASPSLTQGLPDPAALNSATPAGSAGAPSDDRRDTRKSGLFSGTSANSTPPIDPVGPSGLSAVSEASLGVPQKAVDAAVGTDDAKSLEQRLAEGDEPIAPECYIPQYQPPLRYERSRSPALPVTDDVADAADAPPVDKAVSDLDLEDGELPEDDPLNELVQLPPVTTRSTKRKAPASQITDDGPPPGKRSRRTLHG